MWHLGCHFTINAYTSILCRLGPKYFLDIGYCQVSGVPVIPGQVRFPNFELLGIVAAGFLQG